MRLSSSGFFFNWPHLGFCLISYVFLEFCFKFAELFKFKIHLVQLALLAGKKIFFADTRDKAYILYMYTVFIITITLWDMANFKKLLCMYPFVSLPYRDKWKLYSVLSVYLCLRWWDHILTYDITIIQYNKHVITAYITALQCLRTLVLPKGRGGMSFGRLKYIIKKTVVYFCFLVIELVLWLMVLIRILHYGPKCMHNL